VRIALVVITLAAIATGLVQLRRAETMLRHESQRLRLERITLQRRLWDRQVKLGYLLAPDEVRRRARHMSLELVDSTGVDRRPPGPGTSNYIRSRRTEAFHREEGFRD